MMQRNSAVDAPRRRVAVVGAGPGGLSTAIAFHRAGHEVRLFERSPQVQAMGGGVVLSLPVLAILRSYGIAIDDLGAFAVMELRDWKGRLRVRLPFNKRVEELAGLPGWNYGMLRSAAYARMLEVLPREVIHAGHRCVGFEETEDAVRVRFEHGESWEADLLVGADGIHSVVARQVFGDPGLFHCGIQVWLAWCHHEGLPHDVARLAHSPTVQASYFPLLHEGRRGFSWWVIEPWREGQVFEGDVRSHVSRLIEGWEGPLPRLVAATDFERNIYRWEIYNRKPLRSWSRGRVSFVGDAVHPVSPYAGYGMGMAIEDGFWLARSLAGVDLSDRAALSRGLVRYDRQRVGYTNTHMTVARFLGYLFHRTPWPLSAVRDAVFNHTSFLGRIMNKSQLKSAEDQMLALQL